MQVIKENAYAKINLFLDVVGRRSDGFHDVNTVMQTVSLFDTITLSASASPTSRVTLRTDDATLPTDGKNLVVRAAERYLRQAGISAIVDIVLEKKIPVAAGLAGGSSDAAATLRAMDRAFGGALTRAELLDLAATIGSDVPFCLVGGVGLCRGRGEVLTPLDGESRGAYVIGCADESVSTPVAYAELDRIYHNFDGSVRFGRDDVCATLIEQLRGNDVPTALYNIFEEPIFAMASGARMTKELLLNAGARAAQMSGSGPSVFGVFDTEDGAERAAAVLIAHGIRAYTAIGYDQHFI